MEEIRKNDLVKELTEEDLDKVNGGLLDEPRSILNADDSIIPDEVKKGSVARIFYAPSGNQLLRP